MTDSTAQKTTENTLLRMNLFDNNSNIVSVVNGVNIVNISISLSSLLRAKELIDKFELSLIDIEESIDTTTVDKIANRILDIFKNAIDTSIDSKIIVFTARDLQRKIYKCDSVAMHEALEKLIKLKLIVKVTNGYRLFGAVPVPIKKAPAN